MEYFQTSTVRSKKKEISNSSKTERDVKASSFLLLNKRKNLRPRVIDIICVNIVRDMSGERQKEGKEERVKREKERGKSEMERKRDREERCV